MQVDTEHLATMLTMRDIDKAIIQTDKKLKDLPQRATILDTRKKRRNIEEKRAQLDELHADAEARLARITDEDSQLAEKQRQVQEEIDGAQTGYRDIESRTKELNGFAKRRNTLSEDMNKIGDELEKIEGVQAQVTKMLEDIDAREEAATKTFVEEGGALKREIANLEAQHTALAATLPEDLSATYKKLADRHGGVAIGYLQGTSCGVCRAAIEGGRLADMRAQGNVALCPQCGRMLIME